MDGEAPAKTEAAEQTVTDQQLLDELKVYLKKAPKACADAQIAGYYVLNFCKTKPIGFDISQEAYPSGLAMMQLVTINQCLRSLNKSPQVDLELPNNYRQTVSVLQIQSFDPTYNAWRVLASDGRNIAEATLDATQFAEELRLSD